MKFLKRTCSLIKTKTDIVGNYNLYSKVSELRYTYMVEASKQTVLITGVSGYLGSHVALLFLQSGQFNVKGTVRSL